jgi:small-conductance mechanosensitive channel
MTGPAVAPARPRRLSRGLLGALVAFLILPFPAVFLLGPLAGLLLLARPASFREWAWLAVAVGSLATWVLVLPAALPQTITQTGGAVFTGAFLAQVVWRGGPALRRAAAAAGFAMAVAAAGAAARGVSLITSLMQLTGEQAVDLRTSMDSLAVLFPGVTFLGAMAGGVLSVALAGTVSQRPLLAAPGPFSQFRFNDHLIWGALATFAAVLVPHPESWNPFLWNGMLVWGGLYFARGAAGWLAVLRSWPPAPRIALFMGAIVLLPYAVVALVLLGLADTWIDIRRVRRPPTNEGANE